MPTRKEIADAQRRQIEGAKEVDLERLLPQLGFERTNGNGNGVRFEKGNAKVKLFTGRGGQSWWKSFSGDLGEKAGNIIDMIMFVEGCDYRRACTRVREMLCLTDPADDFARARSSAPVLPPATTSLVDSSKKVDPKDSPDEIRKRFMQTCTLWQFGQLVPDYLRSRHFDELNSVFDKTFGVQNDGGSVRNLVFPYYRYDEAGQLVLAGYERKGPPNFERYAKNAEVGFWMSRSPHPHAPLVIAEAPLDALAFDLVAPHATSHRARGIQLQYVALRSGAEEQVLKHVVERCKAGVEKILLATDNDEAGMRYALKIMSGINKLKASDEIPKSVTVRFAEPDFLQKDWADTLAKQVAMSNADAPPPPPPPPACSPSYAPA
jgi:hypothetical protein